LEFALAADAARRTFGASPRLSGRLFLEHHMGAASIALQLRLPMYMVAA